MTINNNAENMTVIDKLAENLWRRKNETTLMEIFNDYLWDHGFKNVSLFPMEEVSDYVDGDIKYFWDMTHRARHYNYYDKYCLRMQTSLESSDSIISLIDLWFGNNGMWDYELARWMIKCDLVDSYWIEK